MEPLQIVLRELRGSQMATVRLGLLWLALGGFVTIFMVTMLSPRSAALVTLPEQAIQKMQLPKAQADVPPAQRLQAAPPPRITAAQRMAARRTAVKVALGQVGVRERGGDSNDSPRIRMYRRAVTGPGEKAWLPEPWCGDFVSWAWSRAGMPLGFGGRGSDYVPELVVWARMTGRWHWARNGYRPRTGDLIVYRANGSLRGHVGMVVKLKGGRIHTIEGNLKDRVMRRSVKPWAGDVTGFISPA